MNLQEIRIGNWLRNESTFFDVTSEFFVFMLLNKTTDYEPILISPWVLEDCGFKHMGKFYSTTQFIESDFYSHWEHPISYYCNMLHATIDSEDRIPIYTINEVIYLHHLQNIFYSLTGKELDIKLRMLKS